MNGSRLSRATRPARLCAIPDSSPNCNDLVRTQRPGCGLSSTIPCSHAKSSGQRLVRLARVAGRAEEGSEGLDTALDWLKLPNAALAGATPLSLLDTDIGAESVLDTLGRIEHGVFP